MESEHSPGTVKWLGQGRNSPTTTKERRLSWDPPSYGNTQRPAKLVHRFSLGFLPNKKMASDTKGSTEDTRLDMSLRLLRDELAQLRRSGDSLSEQMQSMYRTIQDMKCASEEASYRATQQDLCFLAEGNLDLLTECRTRKPIAIPEELDGLCEPEDMSSSISPSIEEPRTFSNHSELESCKPTSDTVHNRSVSDCSMDSAFFDMSSQGLLLSPTSPTPLPPRTPPPPVPPRRAYSIPAMSADKVMYKESQPIRERQTKEKRRSKCEWMLELDVQTATLV
ncbi:Hypp3427 [Branchiostoma lanceolatum]|uniref:Hypp3427 protein n=1 Tax=Branchiostoma lanceolatum TaxID=7740 RepID=A0A8J9ZZS7_BRALA|nr:Hypp3427 [Branchiostoma lanceolatum]